MELGRYSINTSGYSLHTNTLSSISHSVAYWTHNLSLNICSQCLLFSTEISFDFVHAEHCLLLFFTLRTLPQLFLNSAQSAPVFCSHTLSTLLLVQHISDLCVPPKEILKCCPPVIPRTSGLKKLHWTVIENWKQAFPVQLGCSMAKKKNPLMRFLIIYFR